MGGPGSGGNNRKPTELKRKLGNPGKQPLRKPVVALEPMKLLSGPVVPAHHSGEEVVNAILEAGAAAWIGKTDELGVVQLLIEGWDRRRKLLDHLNQHGESYQTDFGIWARRPEAITLEALEKRITVWLSQLGLTPADRGRLGLAEVRRRTKLEELRERRERMGAGHPAG